MVCCHSQCFLIQVTISSITYLGMLVRVASERCQSRKESGLVEFDSNALRRIATEVTPENDHERHNCGSYNDVETVSAYEGRRSNFEKNEECERNAKSLKWATPQDPGRPARHFGELFIRCKFRHCFFGNWRLWPVPVQHVFGATLPAVSVFVFDPGSAIATAPHNRNRY
jgi:hypothetical protein